ncbi:MAG TPA: DUF2267 domain-containing protein [Chitinispirillaceae bacterium]|nr:DUF2267 domain-containing protein [Chitinispirillaceae bacterium]
MAWTGLETFDTAVQKADIWLKEIMIDLNVDSRRIAYAALRAVLHTLRDRLTIDEAVDLGAQLPLLIKGVYYDEWDPSRTPIKDRHLDDFLTRMSSNYHGDPQIGIHQIARSVFRLLEKKVTEGEIEDVQGMLPKEFSELWR